MPVGDISKTEGWEVTLGWPGTSLQYLPDCNSNEVTIFRTSCALPLADQQSSSEIGPYMWLMTDLIKNKMVFWDTCFFFSVIEMNKLHILRGYCFIHDRYFLRALMGLSRSSSLSPYTKLSKEGVMDSSNLGLWIEEFWVLAMKSGTKKNMQDFHPCECQTQKERPCNSLILLDEVGANKKHIFQARCSFKDNFRGP